jgi:hypothetical protein
VPSQTPSVDGPVSRRRKCASSRTSAGKLLRIDQPARARRDKVELLHGKPRVPKGSAAVSIGQAVRSRASHDPLPIGFLLPLPHPTSLPIVPVRTAGLPTRPSSPAGRLRDRRQLEEISCGTSSAHSWQASSSRDAYRARGLNPIRRTMSPPRPAKPRQSATTPSGAPRCRCAAYLDRDGKLGSASSPASSTHPVRNAAMTGAPTLLRGTDCGSGRLA